MKTVVDDEKLAGSSAPHPGPVEPGRLEFINGGANITIAGDPSLHDLYSAHFSGPSPTVRRDGNNVVIEYPRFMLFRWSSTRAHVGLNPIVPWRIEIARGVSSLMADLRKLELHAIEVVGGASRAELWLPQPHGTVDIRVTGGVSRFRLHRPAGIAVRIQIGGGASKLGLDRQFLGAVGGPIQLETPDYTAAVDRYELDILGGASRVTADQEG